MMLEMEGILMVVTFEGMKQTLGLIRLTGLRLFV